MLPASLQFGLSLLVCVLCLGRSSKLAGTASRLKMQTLFVSIYEFFSFMCFKIEHFHLSAVSFTFRKTAKLCGKERQKIQENKQEWTNRAEGTPQR